MISKSKNGINCVSYPDDRRPSEALTYRGLELYAVALYSDSLTMRESKEKRKKALEVCTANG